MAKKEFKTLEEAMAHIAKQDEALTKLAGEKSEAIKARDAANKERDEAKKIALEAVAQVNESEAALPKKVTVMIDKKKVHIRFGVDGLTKEELAKDKDKVAKLLAGGSSAVKVLEG